MQSPTRGEVEERALFAPILKGQQDLVFDRELWRASRFTPLLRQYLEDSFDHAPEGIGFYSAVAFEFRRA